MRPCSFGDNGVADPDETGVSNWLNTVDHFAYLERLSAARSFGPDNNMTRAEAAQMFYNLLLDKDVPTTVTFMDVDERHLVRRCRPRAGVAGHHQRCRRQPLCSRSGPSPGQSLLSWPRGLPMWRPPAWTTFSDVSESDWFFTYVATCVQYGWIDGYPDGTFRPDNSITRCGGDDHRQPDAGPQCGLGVCGRSYGRSNSVQRCGTHALGLLPDHGGRQCPRLHQVRRHGGLDRAQLTSGKMCEKGVLHLEYPLLASKSCCSQKVYKEA